MNRYLFVYELNNVIGNIFTIMFGIVLPIVMSVLFTNLLPFTKGLPEAALLQINSGIFLSLMMVIPMASMFIGYAAVYSQEMEQGVPLRLNLFGVKTRSILAAKLLSNLLFLIASTLIYIIVGVLAIKMYYPTLSGLILSLLVVLILGGIFLVLSHGIASLCGKFSSTFAITMSLYFGFMVLCGTMGIRVSQFPDFVQKIAKLFPMTYMGLDDGFINVWKGENFQANGLLLSFAFLTIVSVAILFVSQRKNKRHKLVKVTS